MKGKKTHIIKRECSYTKLRKQHKKRNTKHKTSRGQQKTSVLMICFLHEKVMNECKREDQRSAISYQYLK